MGISGVSKDSLFSKGAEHEDDEEDDGVGYVMDCQESDNQLVQACTAMEADFNAASYGRKESSTFFEEQHKRKDDNGGVMYLVNRAQTQQTSVLAHTKCVQHSQE
jgi:hypothetical protein